MRGRTGVLHSGYSVYRVAPDGSYEADGVAEARVSFAADVTDREIEAYVATGEPLSVAGAFTVDSLGGALIYSVEGDPSTVVGMSLLTVAASSAILCAGLAIALEPRRLTFPGSFDRHLHTIRADCCGRHSKRHSVAELG